MSLAELAARRSTLPITAAINRWKTEGSRYEAEAVEMVQAAMRHDLLTDHRSNSAGRIRPSMIGKECQRLHALSMLGYKGVDFSQKSLGFMDAGTWAHYQWQAMLLSAYLQGLGGIKEIEQVVEYKPWKLRGSIDGLQEDDTPFELKTKGHFAFHGGKYAAGIGNATEPELGNYQQTMGYMKSLGVRKASIVYVSRDNNNDFKEFRVDFDDAIFKTTDAFMKGIHRKTKAGNLPEMLKGCAAYESGDFSVSSTQREKYKKVFEECPMHEVCPGAVAVQQEA